LRQNPRCGGKPSEYRFAQIRGIEGNSAQKSRVYGSLQFTYLRRFRDLKVILRKNSEFTEAFTYGLAQIQKIEANSAQKI
jgi:hypothetical protein